MTIGAIEHSQGKSVCVNSLPLDEAELKLSMDNGYYLCNRLTQKESTVCKFDAYRLICVRSGMLEIQTVDSTIRIAEGESLFICRGEYLSVWHPGENGLFESIEISLESELLEQFIHRHGDMLAKKKTPASAALNTLHFEKQYLIQRSLEGLMALFQYEHPYMLRWLKIEELLVLLLHTQQGDEFSGLLRQQTNNTSTRLRLFMEANYMRDWRLEDYAREFGASLTTFKELFNSIYNISPRAWISERRMLYAHQLLLTSEMSIVDIAMESGFSSQSYFTQSYRRRFGTTPSRMRNQPSEP